VIRSPTLVLLAAIVAFGAGIGAAVLVAVLAASVM
jgi:hypothetical protein